MTLRSTVSSLGQAVARFLVGQQSGNEVTARSETDTQARRRLARKAYAETEAARLRKCREWFETANG